MISLSDLFSYIKPKKSQKEIFRDLVRPVFLDMKEGVFEKRKISLADNEYHKERIETRSEFRYGNLSIALSEIDSFYKPFAQYMRRDKLQIAVSGLQDENLNQDRELQQATGLDWPVIASFLPYMHSKKLDTEAGEGGSEEFQFKIANDFLTYRVIPEIKYRKEEIKKEKKEYCKHRDDVVLRAYASTIL